MKWNLLNALIIIGYEDIQMDYKIYITSAYSSQCEYISCSEAFYMHITCTFDHGEQIGPTQITQGRKL